MRVSFLFSVCALLLASCADSKPATSKPSKPNIYTSIPPSAYLLERVGGDKIEVNTVLRGGENPATYEPSARQMVGLEKSTAYFYIGLPFEESFIKKLNAALPNLPKVDLKRDIPLRKTGCSGCGNHHHDDGDPHLWLSPKIAKMQGAIILEELTKLAPAHKEFFKSNYNKLIEELDALDTELKTLLKPLAGRSIFIHHPALGYLTDAYGITQIAVEFEGKEPSPKRVDEFIKQAKNLNISVIFVQPQFVSPGTEVIAKAIGGRVVEVDPLAHSLIENIRAIALELVKSQSM